MNVWINGALVSDPTVSAFDHGFTVGDGVFETMKTIHGQPFALTRHLRRLVHSATGLLMAPPDLDAIRAGIHAVMDPRIATGRLRITVSTGIGPSGYSRDPQAPPTVVIWHTEASAGPIEAKVVTVPWPRNERSPVVGLKTTSYAENVLAAARAHQAGADEAIFANTEGDLCEGTGSNLIVRLHTAHGKRWCTPPLTSGALPGITRELALEWFNQIEEREIAMHELHDVDAILLASSTRDLQPVATLDGRQLAGANDPETMAMQARFRSQMALNIDP